MTAPHSRTVPAIAHGEMEYRRQDNGFRVYPRPPMNGSTGHGSASVREALLRKIRSRHRRLDYWPAFFFSGVIWTAVLAWQGSGFRTLASAILVTLAAAAAAAALDRHRGAVTIFYELPPQTEEAIREACGLWERLRQEKAGGTGWPVDRPQMIFPVRFNCSPPRWMRTNVAVPSLSLDEGVIHFLPDRLLVLSPDDVRSVSYRFLRLERRLHSCPSSALLREVLHLSWGGSASCTYAFAFADRRTGHALETALRLLKEGQIPAPLPLHLPPLPASQIEEATGPVLSPGAV